MSNEEGFAFGGPIVEDVLGFRVSAIKTHDAGYIDAKSTFDGHTFANNVNWHDANAIRGALKWQVNNVLSVTPAIYRNVFWLPTPQQNYAGGNISRPAERQSISRLVQE